MDKHHSHLLLEIYIFLFTLLFIKITLNVIKQVFNTQINVFKSTFNKIKCHKYIHVFTLVVPLPITTN